MLEIYIDVLITIIVNGNIVIGKIFVFSIFYIKEMCIVVYIIGKELIENKYYYRVLNYNTNNSVLRSVEGIAGLPVTVELLTVQDIYSRIIKKSQKTGKYNFLVNASIVLRTNAYKYELLLEQQKNGNIKYLFKTVDAKTKEVKMREISELKPQEFRECLDVEGGAYGSFSRLNVKGNNVGNVDGHIAENNIYTIIAEYAKDGQVEGYFIANQVTGNPRENQNGREVVRALRPGEQVKDILSMKTVVRTLSLVRDIYRRKHVSHVFLNADIRQLPNDVLSIVPTKKYSEEWDYYRINATENTVNKSNNINPVNADAMLWCMKSGDKEFTAVYNPGEESKVFERIRSKAIKSLKIPNGVTSLAELHDAEYLREVWIPDSVTKINAKEVSNCPQLEVVHIGAGVDYISPDAFVNTDIQRFVVSPKNKVYKTTDDGILLKRERVNNKGNSIVELVRYPNGKRDYKYNLSKLVNEHKVNTIGVGAFSLCNYLEVVQVPREIMKVGTAAFFGCGKLREVYISAKIVENECFDYCPKLERVIFGAGIEKIRGTLFRSNAALKYIVVADTIKEISAIIDNSNGTPTKYYLNNAQENGTLVIFFPWSHFKDLKTNPEALKAYNGIIGPKKENGEIVGIKARAGIVLKKNDDATLVKAGVTRLGNSSLTMS